MTEPIPTSPPRARSGCFAKGCLIFVGLFVFLSVAFIGGGFWALRHFQKTYSATSPLNFGNVTSTEQLTDTELGDDEDVDTDEAAPVLEDQPVPQPMIAQEPYAKVRSRWRAFEKAAKRNQPTRIALTEGDINALFAGDPKLRGKANVAVANNSARVKVSVPLDDIFMMKGRYLNGEATVEPSPDGDPRKVRISNVILGEQAVPEAVLDRRLLGWSSIRGLMVDWLDDNNIDYFTIQNGTVIGATRGAPR
ncbi:MAG: hypothetical protein H0T11_06165 [Chthoniobacterales bacterium]|nr:hypothetical protein [Chthoniobacterales bacterium]